jgi:hypothetical protein
MNIFMILIFSKFLVATLLANKNVSISFLYVATIKVSFPTTLATRESPICNHTFN